MSVEEFHRWVAYDLVEPIPDLNWLMAQVCQVIANANRAAGKKPFKVDDFVPRKVKVKPKSIAGQTTDEVKAVFRRLG
jgi:hypothetical protein